MPFTGKATYSAGATLPEIAEDVSDVVGVLSPTETPLLDALGDPARAARSTVHEWLEDQPAAVSDAVTGVDGSTLAVETPSLFRAGDQVRVRGTGEVLLVQAVDTDAGAVTVARSYGGSELGDLGEGDVLQVLGNAPTEGADADPARFTVRARRTNYTQIFAATVEVSGSELAVRQLGVRDELDWQKAMRLRELLRDLEACVINGRAPTVDPQGSASVRRTMRGIVGHIQTHTFRPGVSGFPAGAALTEPQLNAALRAIWEGGGSPDLIVVGGREKRAINQFVAANRRYYNANESYKDMLSVYESDFGVCRVLLSRHVPQGSVLLLDSRRIEVMPLAGRSFGYKPLARTGDREAGQLVGEYTLEFRNEAAHGLISGLTA